MDDDLDKRIRVQMLVSVEEAFTKFTSAISYATRGEERDDLNRRAIALTKQTMDALGFPWEASAEEILERVRKFNIDQDTRGIVEIVQQHYEDGACDASE